MVDDWCIGADWQLRIVCLYRFYEPGSVNVDNKFFAEQFLQESASVNFHSLIRENLRSNINSWWSSSFKQILDFHSRIFWSRCRCSLWKACRILSARNLLWRLDVLEAQPSFLVILLRFLIAGLSSHLPLKF